MAKDEIKSALEKALKKLGVSDVPIIIEKPGDPLHGDYSSNVALIAAKKVGKNPMELAEQLAAQLKVKSAKLKVIEKIEVAKPGFINFSLSTDYLIEEAQHIATSLQPKTSNLQPTKIMVEFTDPNPFKEFHIGHLYSNTVGESICRLLEATGNTVWRADFFGDVGMHVAKALYGIRQKLREEHLTLDDLAKRPLEQRVQFMGQGYALGSAEYEKSDEQKEAMKQINLLVFIAAQQYWQETKDFAPRVDYRKHLAQLDQALLGEMKTLWVTGRQWSLDYFETIYKRLGTTFDGYYPESLTGEWGYDFVMKGLEKGIFEKSDGAVVYKGEQDGLHTRVFINKLGLPTYETKDIGNAPYKYSEFAYDDSLIITANEINEYFKVVIAAMKRVNRELGDKTRHLGHGVVRLPGGKMSSRTGNIISGEWLLDEAKNRIHKAYPDMDMQTLEMVAVGAVKYALLKGSIGRDVTFDFDESINLQGNSGPYLQYTFARTQSVLGKAKKNYELPASRPGGRITNYKLENEEKTLLRLLAQFDEVVDKAAGELQPHVVAEYLFDLAQTFNNFYQKHKILPDVMLNEREASSTKTKNGRSFAGAQDDSTSLRLMLTGATGNVLKRGLDLLGIQSPEKM